MAECNDVRPFHIRWRDLDAELCELGQPPALGGEAHHWLCVRRYAVDAAALLIAARRREVVGCG